MIKNLTIYIKIDVMPFANLFVSLQNATHLVRNLKMLFVMLNVKNLLVKFTVQTKLVKSKNITNLTLNLNYYIGKIAQNV